MQWKGVMHPLNIQSDRWNKKEPVEGNRAEEAPPVGMRCLLLPTLKKVHSQDGSFTLSAHEPLALCQGFQAGVSAGSEALTASNI